MEGQFFVKTKIISWAVLEIAVKMHSQFCPYLADFFCLCTTGPPKLPAKIFLFLQKMNLRTLYFKPIIAKTLVHKLYPTAIWDKVCLPKVIGCVTWAISLVKACRLSFNLDSLTDWSWASQNLCIMAADPLHSNFWPCGPTVPIKKGQNNKIGLLLDPVLAHSR